MGDLVELRKQAHLSASSLGTYLRCPLQYRFRYIDRIPNQWKSAELLFGTAIDRTVAVYFNHFIETGDRLDAVSLVEIFDDTWSGLVAKETLPVKFKDGQDTDTLADLGRKIARLAAEQIDPSRITATKPAFTLEIKGVPLPIIGEIDALETGAIVEIKTSARKYSDNQVDNHLQVAIYGMWLNHEELVDDILIKLLIFTKTKVPELQTLYRVIDREQDQRTTALIREVWQAIKNESFYPNPNFLCASCQYQSECQSWV